MSGLRDLGVDAVGLSGVDGGLLIAERIPKLGLVASVVGLRRDLLDAILVGGQVPVVAPLARDADGIVCNVNADDVAAGIAAGLGARQLVLLTDVDGVRDADGRRLDALTVGRGRDAHRIRRHRRRHGAQGPRRARGARLGRRRGDHRRLVRARGPRTRPHRPDLRDAHHAPSRDAGPRDAGRRTATVPRPATTPNDPSHDLKAQRQRAIRELVATRPIGSQREVVDALGAQGFEVTQATVSRDISELGLVKAPGADGHVYVTPGGRRVGERRPSRRTTGSSGSSPTSPSASGGAG